MSVSPRSLTSFSSDSDNDHEVPWDDVERSLVNWLKALRLASASGNVHKVLSLLEALLNFVSCNDGSFLHTIVDGENMEQGLRARGAPDSFITVCKEVIQCTGSMEGPSILSFGTCAGMPAHLAADLIAGFQAVRPSSPGVRSGSPRRRPNFVPQRSTNDMLDDLWHASASAEGPAVVLECASSHQICRMENTVAVTVEQLSDRAPAVISGLENADAAPFLFLNWLNNCFVEVFFCIYHGGTTFVLKRRVVYVGPRPGTQLESQPAIEGKEGSLLLEGCNALPWVDVAGLLLGESP